MIRSAELIYICQKCGQWDGGLVMLERLDPRRIIIEDECRREMCACDEHTVGGRCKTKRCGGTRLATFYDCRQVQVDVSFRMRDDVTRR